jgi:hypothetical protein
LPPGDISNQKVKEMATPAMAPTVEGVDVLSIASADLLDESFVVGLSIFAGCTLALSIMATVLAEAYNAHRRGDATDARFELWPPPVLESRLLPRPGVASGSVATAAAGRALATRSAPARDHAWDEEAPPSSGGNDPSPTLPPNAPALPDAPRVHFALGDPLLLVFLLQGVALTGRLSGLPASYAETICAPFEWATLELSAPAWAAGIMALRGGQGGGPLAEPHASDDVDRDLPTVGVAKI